MDMHKADNRILGVAYTLAQKGKTVIFVSKDINARLKADSLGIEVMDFEKQKVKFDELFTGHCEVRVQRGGDRPPLQGQGSWRWRACDSSPNEFVLLIDEADEKHTALTRSLGDGKLVACCPTTTRPSA